MVTKWVEDRCLTFCLFLLFGTSLFSNRSKAAHKSTILKHSESCKLLMRGRSAWTFEIRTAPQRQQTLTKPPGSPVRTQHATRSARFSIAHTAAIQHIGKETIVYGSTLAAPGLEITPGAHASWIA